MKGYQLLPTKSDTLGTFWRTTNKLYYRRKAIYSVRFLGLQINNVSFINRHVPRKIYWRARKRFFVSVSYLRNVNVKVNGKKRSTVKERYTVVAKNRVAMYTVAKINLRLLSFSLSGCQIYKYTIFLLPPHM